MESISIHVEIPNEGFELGALEARINSLAYSLVHERCEDVETRGNGTRLTNLSTTQEIGEIVALAMDAMTERELRRALTDHMTRYATVQVLQHELEYRDRLHEDISESGGI